MNKIIEKLSPTWRWILFLPMAYIASTTTNFLIIIILTASIQPLLKVFSVQIFSFIFGPGTMFVSTFVAAWIILRMAPKYSYQILFLLNGIYVVYHCFNTSKIGIKFFSIVFAVVLASILAALLMIKRNKKIRVFPS